MSIHVQELLLLLLLLITFQYNRIIELKTYELETSEVLTVCQQLGMSELKILTVYVHKGSSLVYG